MTINPTIVLIAASSLAIAVFLAIVFLKFRTRRNNRMQVIRRLIEQDQCEYLLLDVRSRREYKTGRIPTAVNLPISSIREKLPSENMFLPIYVYAARRRTARVAAEYLDENGYFNVLCLGAFRTWKGTVEK